VKIVGFKELPIQSLTLPGDWLKILEEPEVIERAESIDKHGLIHEPVVRDGTFQVLAGRRRIAATQRLGQKTVLCKVVSCSDSEAVEVEYQENLQRRRYTAEQERELRQKRQDMLASILARESKGAEPRKPGQTGRVKTPRGKAREVVAKERGVKPETLRKQEYRNKQRKEKAGGKADAELRQEADPINALGLELDEQFSAQVRAIQLHVKEVNLLLRQASAKLTHLKNAELGYPDARLDRMRENLKSFTAVVANATPSCLCPWCKAIPAVMAECSACGSSGWITPDMEDAVPSELLETDEPKVVYQGSVRLAAEFLSADPGEPDDASSDDDWGDSGDESWPS
jgi:ParB-like chromosome segregation protein Spo0J